jgi:hypothetical protein
MSNPDGFSTETYFEALSVSHLVDWFAVPRSHPDHLTFAMRKEARSTLGPLKIRVDGRRATHGKIFVSSNGLNPTRTLSHLLADIGGNESFLRVIAELHPLYFFAATSNPVPYAYGEITDNWLNDPVQVQRCLGRDPFGSFLPIYVSQLQALVNMLVAPSDTSPIISQGGNTLISEHGVRVQLRWSEVRVPQIETYFERHHQQAVGSVGTAALVALGGLDRVDVRRHVQHTSDWAERRDDCLTISTPLNETYRLVIYAKSRTRIRFEVRRLRKGDYTSLPEHEGQANKLLSIINLQRRYLLTAARWDRIGAMFDEPSTPSIGDLTRLCGLVARACLDYDADVQVILTRLLEHGDLCPSRSDGYPAGLITELCALGVLHRVSVGRRDHQRSTKRYTLAPDFRSLVAVVTTYLGTSAAQAA